MSPGWSAFIGTCGNIAIWASELCGMYTPACAQACCVRPEQSKHDGPTPA